MMQKLFLSIITVFILLGCNNNTNDKTETPDTSIKDDKLTGFLLGGVYFFNGYGGAQAVFEMVKGGTTADTNTSEFTEQLNKSYNEIMVFPFGPDQEASSKETLKSYWKITDKKTFMETLDYLKKSGDNDEFMICKKMIDDNGGPSADLTVIESYQKDEEIREKLAFIKNNYTNISKTGIKAWDYARYVNNVCVGYSAGYITRNEGEKLITELLSLARNQYENWEEYYNDYYMGLQYWGGDKAHEEEYAKTLKEIMEGDYSIYKYLTLK